MLALLILAVPAALPSAAVAQESLSPPDLPPTASQAYIRLLDGNRSPLDRRAAALALLKLDNRESRRALASALTEGAAPSGWRAIAEAVAIYPDQPPHELLAPMLALLPRAPADAQTFLAEALGRYRDRELTDRLMELAGRSGASYEARRGPILALGHQRTQDAAGFLIELTRPSEPEAVQATAYDALAVMAGLDEYGHDRGLWIDWWDQARRWSDDTWRERLMANLARRDARRRAQQQILQERLLESQRALYRTTTPEDRPAVLAYMLGDSLRVIRQLAIDLSLQRLVDDLPFDEPLRQALRGRLSDPDAAIRRRSALLLRDLADAPAADRAADQLARGQENSLPVLQAYLLLLTRLPRAQAVEPALELLDQRALRGEAAGLLAAAYDAGLLNRRQGQNTAKRIREFLQENPTPAPQVATLLGKVGNDDDWDRIAAWIDSPDPALKRAAAAAWAESSRSLQILADRVSDPVIEPIIIAAAQRGGDDPWTLRALSQHRPNQPQAAQAWEGALIAMAGRVEPAVVLETVLRIESRGAPAALLERILTASIQARDDQPASQIMVPLFLKRAELRLSAGHAAAALADYQQVLTIERTAVPQFHLSVQASQRLQRGMIRAHLQAGQSDEAFAVARSLLGVDGAGGPTTTDDPIIDRFLEAARSYADANRRDAARKVLVDLRRLLGPAMRPEVAQRIALLEAEIPGPAVTQPPSPTEPPATQATDTPATATYSQFIAPATDNDVPGGPVASDANTTRPPSADSAGPSEAP